MSGNTNILKSVNSSKLLLSIVCGSLHDFHFEYYVLPIKIGYCSASRDFHSMSLLPVLKTHNIVQYWVQCRVEVVEESRDMKKIFIDCPEKLAMLEVDIDKTLGMKWCPTQEESNNNSR